MTEAEENAAILGNEATRGSKFVRQKPEEMPFADEDDSSGMTHAKGQTGVVFVDEKGVVFSFQFSYLYRCSREGDDLVLHFSEHRVRIKGRGLFAPVHTSLLMMLTLHKKNLVEALVGGESRDFGTGKAVVTSISVEEIKRG